MTEYNDFILKLNWLNDKVCVSWEGKDEKSQSYPESFNLEGIYPITKLYEEGKKIASLLFPSEDIQEKFRAWWREKRPIRLRLCYPENEEAVLQLLQIPWECIYLSLDKDKLDDRAYFLSLRDDISIVHSIPSSKPIQKASVDQLKVKMKYFSHLGNSDDEKASARKILERLKYQSDKRLNTVIDCSFMKNEEITHNAVSNALKTENLIHFTTHGDSDKITIGKEKLSLRELLNPSKFGVRSNLKALILLSCNSGGSYRSLATTFHQEGVPIVISTTCTIHFLQQENFVDGFYSKLAEPPIACLEQAMVAGRQGIFREESANSNEWGAGFAIPRLYLNSPDSFLIPEKLLFGSTEMLQAISRYILGMITIKDWSDAKIAPQPKNTDINEDSPDNVWINQGESLFDALQTMDKGATTPSMAKHEDASKAGSDPTNTDEDLNRLKTWIKDEKSSKRWFFVAGSSDSNQSSHIATLVNEFLSDLLYSRGKGDDSASMNALKKLNEGKNPKLIYHFCMDYGTPNTCDPLDFIRYSLVPQLAAYYNEEYAKRFDEYNLKQVGKDYYAWCPPEKYPLFVGNADDAMRSFVLEPLKKLRTLSMSPGKEEPLPVIVIDGVDMNPWYDAQDTTILDLLRDHKNALDKVVRVLVTAKKNNEASVLKLIHGDGPDIDFSSKESSWVGEISFLADRIPKFENLIGSERVKNWDTDLSAFALGEAHGNSSETDWQKLRDKFWQEAIDAAKNKNKNISLLLDVAATAYAPLSHGDLILIMPPSAVSGEIKDLLAVLDPNMSPWSGSGEIPIFDPFFNKLEENKIVLCHRTLRQHILNNLKNSAADIHARFVNAFTFWNHYHGSTYAKRHLVRHTYESFWLTKPSDGLRKGRADQFLDLVCKSDFRTQRLIEVGIADAIQDIEKALRVIFAQYVLSSNAGNRGNTVAIYNNILATTDEKLKDFEKQLRQKNAGKKILFQHLNLDPQ